jgi:hypothetical protein
MADQKTYTFINPDDIKVVPATKWVIKPLIPAAEILVGCGAPKHLKTLLLQGALFTVASHLPDFFGYEIPRRRKLLYAINEGGDAFLGRTKAWQKLRNVPTFEDHLRICRQMPNLVDPQSAVLNEFKRRIDAEKFEPDIITFDTLNRTMPGANEDTPSLSLVFDRLGQLQEWKPGLTIVLLHHTKKDELRFRGGQVIAGNADGLLYVERPDMNVMRANVTCDWFRNAANFAAFSFTCTLAPVMTDDGLQDFPAVNGIGPMDAQVAEGQDWKDKKNAADSAKDEAYLLIRAKLQYTYNAWFRDTADAIKFKYNRGLGDGTFSTAIKALVTDGFVLDLGSHYQVDQVVSPGEAHTSGGGFDAAAHSTSNFRLPPYKGAEVPEVEVVASGAHFRSAGSGSRVSCNDGKTVAPETAKAADLARQAMEQIRKRQH